MLKDSMHIWLFAAFALGFPIWAMDNNGFTRDRAHICVGECYDNWEADTGGVVAIEIAKAEAKAAASPEELGKAAYIGCIACHGAGGEGGVGPMLSGRTADEIYNKLIAYKNGETIGSQSALMWSQSAMLSDDDMKNIAAFIETL